METVPKPETDVIETYDHIIAIVDAQIGNLTELLYEVRSLRIAEATKRKQAEHYARQAELARQEVTSTHRFSA